MEVEVVERKDMPGTWSVGAIDMENDGVCYLAVFSGPRAKEGAEEYRDWKYPEGGDA